MINVASISVRVSLLLAFLMAFSSLGRAECQTPNDDALFEGISRHDLGAIVKAIDDGACLESVRSEVETPLCFAAMNGHPDVVDILIKRGASFNGNEFHNPLRCAVRRDRLSVVKQLLTAGSEPNGAASLISPPLYEAAARSNSEIVETLLNAGAKIDPVRGYSPLLVASQKGLTSMVQKLLNHSANPNLPGNATPFSVEYPLEGAMEYSGNEDIALFLLKAGADVEKTGSISPLQWAVYRNKQSSFDLLLEHRASTRNALKFLRDNLHIAEVLLSRGENPNVIPDTRSGSTILFSQNRSEVIRALIKAGADIDARDKYGNTSLHGHQFTSGAEAAIALLDSGASLDIQNVDGETALMGWCLLSCNTYFGQCAQVDYALAHRQTFLADLRNGKGQSALMLLVQRTSESTEDGRDTHKQRIRSLVSHGANVNGKDRNGKRVLDYANNDTIRKLLIELGAN